MGNVRNHRPSTEVEQIPQEPSQSVENSERGTRNMPPISSSTATKKVSFNVDGQSRVDTTHIHRQNHKIGYQSTRSRLATLKIVATSKSSIRDRMVARGQQMVESDYLSFTSIKVEFNIPKTVGEYNAREQFIQLLELLKKEDPTLKVQSSGHHVPEWKILHIYRKRRTSQIPLN